MCLSVGALREEFPNLVIASVSGFGTSGPLREAAGLDQVAQAMSGLMSVTGADADNTYRVGVPIADTLAGLYVTIGILSGLASKNHGGHTVNTSLLEAAIFSTAFQAQSYLSTANVPRPQGNDHLSLTPYGVFRTADVPIVIAVCS